MSKRLDAMRAKPKGNWQAADVKAVCDEFEILCEPPRRGGSHFKVGHGAIQRKLTIPFKKTDQACIHKAAGGFR